MLDKLVRKYSESHRHYHNLNHIVRMFEVAKLQCLNLSRVQIFAIWFHDYVYDCPKSENHSNEVKSAYSLAHDRCVRVELTSFEVDIAMKIICDTENHIPTCEESKYVIDLDLYDLGIPERYELNKELIRNEFSYLTDDKFKIGRLQFLKRMLDRQTIYVSNFINSVHEDTARRMMETEYNTLIKE